MRYKLRLQIMIILLLVAGCHAPFVEVGIGYNRFEMDEIRSTVMIDSQPVETRLTHVDAFTTKVRSGAQFVEAVPQMRSGIELRGSFGGTADTERRDGEKAYSEIVMLLFGIGPFLAWQQPLGEYLYLEAGGYFTGYTVGVHQKGRMRYALSFDTESEGGVGWGGGAYGKIGVQQSESLPCRIAGEFAYERGEWDFGGDIGKTDVDGYSFLISSEIDF